MLASKASKARYYNRKSRGLCTECGNPMEENSKYTRCQKCADKVRARTRRRMEQGLCKCGKGPVVPGAKQCKLCQTRGRTRSKIKGLSKIEIQKAEESLESFDGRCQSCGSECSGRNCHLDHKGDKFRGIICSTCNFSLGLLKDSEDRILQLLYYLKRFEFKCDGEK